MEIGRRRNNEKVKALFKTFRAYRTVYLKYIDMLKRCYNPKTKNYQYYGARGIRVCEEWQGEEGLYNFCKWILSIGYDENKSGRQQSLDKINNDGNYEPSNCRLATPSIQNGNMRTKTKTGYKGVLLAWDGSAYYASVKVEGKRFYIGNSKSKNECARMRNQYIIDHNLQKPLNVIKEELEDIRPTRISIYKVYDKRYVLLYKVIGIKQVSRITNLSKGFIESCLSGKRNSKFYNFEREERVIYEY